MQELFAKTLMGKEIRAEVRRLDEGINVLLTGGEKSHIGAVSCWTADGELRTMQLPGHKEGVVSEAWARTLGAVLRETVCVECGIHYDHLEPEGIHQVVKATEELLMEVKDILGGTK